MTFRLKAALISSCALSLFIADRIFKNYFLQNPQRSGDFIVDFFGMRFVKNYGISYGLFSTQHVAYRIALIVVVSILIIALIHFLYQAYEEKKIFHVAALLLVIVGAVSNLLDRIFYGFVIDYLDVTFFTIFNLSDVMITIGVIGIIGREIINKTTRRI